MLLLLLERGAYVCKRVGACTATRAAAWDEGLGSVLATPVTNLKCSALEPEDGELPGHERSHAGTQPRRGRRDSLCQCPATVSRA
eukprot:161305-Rhodomonas_salina.1